MPTLQLPRLRRWRRRPLHAAGRRSRTVDAIRAELAAERDAARGKHQAVIDPPTIRMHSIDVDGGRPLHDLDYARRRVGGRWMAGPRWAN